jgi:signal transduction histidine kinase/CheY-like chemotaxis protein
MLNEIQILAGFILLGIIIIALIVVTVYQSRLLRNKSSQLKTLGTKLKHFDKYLDSLVQTRTAEIHSALVKAEENDNQKNTFIANISIDIRTQVKGILELAKSLNDKNLPPDTRNKFTEIIANTSKNLLNVLSNIINISQIDSGALEVNKTSFNLNQLLTDLYSQFYSDSRLFSKPNLEIKLVQSLSNAKSTIVSDPNRLTQILNILVDNAIKFTSKGCIEIGYHVDNNNNIIFFVKDTGIGIPELDKRMIFNRFHKVNRTHKGSNVGTGLGLSICKGMVELLDGKMWLESEVDKGSSFFFSIPLVLSKEHESIYLSFSNISKQKPDFSEKVILVVEDDLNSFQFVEALLSDTNAKIIHAKNGEDGVEICRLIEDIDLILMDMQLPFINGYEATSQIKAINPNLTIIAQTAYVMSDDKAKCLKAGCDDYIPKPIDPDEFLRIITRYLPTSIKS